MSDASRRFATAGRFASTLSAKQVRPAYAVGRFKPWLAAAPSMAAGWMSKQATKSVRRFELIRRPLPALEQVSDARM